eukprot:1160599-Pelagomonas_calceolata.AAC.8
MPASTCCRNKHRVVNEQDVLSAAEKYGAITKQDVLSAAMYPKDGLFVKLYAERDVMLARQDAWAA